MIFSVCAMADESAIFIRDIQVTCLGEIHWIENGEIKAFSPNMIMRGRDAWGDCDERNTASSKLLERLGFQLIKTVDDAYKEDADGNPIMIRSRVYKLTA